MKKTVLVFFFLLHLTSFAQVSTQKRIELELFDGYTNEQIYQFGEKGFILFSNKERTFSPETEWKIDFYNSELEIETTKSLFIPNRYALTASYKSEENFHALFKTKSGDYKLLTVSPATKEPIVIDGVLPKKAYSTQLIVNNEYAYIQSVINKRNALFSVNWKSGNQNFIPIPFDSSKNTSKIELQFIEESNEVFLYLWAKRGQARDVIIMRLNDKGQAIDDFKLTENITTNFINITASYIDKDHYIFTNLSGQSQGLFFCEYENGKLKALQYKNYLDLKNFLTFLPTKKQEKIEAKKAKKEAAGKQLNFDYYMAGHPIVKLNDGYLYMGEAYYPTYRTESYTYYRNGVPFVRTRQVFDGYQYTHAIIVKYDLNGNIVWDQTFEMYPRYKPFVVKRFINYNKKDTESIKLVFSSHQKIVSKVFDYDGTLKQDKKAISIETNDEDDKTKATTSNINYWYDNYFLAYGVQKIKNSSEKELSKKRTVYFVNKIKFE